MHSTIYNWFLYATHDMMRECTHDMMRECTHDMMRECTHDMMRECARSIVIIPIIGKMLIMWMEECGLLKLPNIRRWDRIVIVRYTTTLPPSLPSLPPPSGPGVARAVAGCCGRAILNLCPYRWWDMWCVCTHQIWYWCHPDLEPKFRIGSRGYGIHSSNEFSRITLIVKQYLYLPRLFSAWPSSFPRWK